MNQDIKEKLLMDWQADIPEAYKTHETRIQEIANWFVREGTTTNKDVYALFPGPLYKRAWETLKQRGGRNSMIFFEDGKWIYFP